MASDTSDSYQGDELTLFADARRWKAYLSKTLQPCMGRTVLEVGAGLGGTTVALVNDTHSRWVCLEPDGELCQSIEEKLQNGSLPSQCEVVQGRLETLEKGQHFDSVIYIDVLEHIEHDAQEMQAAMEWLAPDGQLIVLCPAFQQLYTPFDASVGHFRRYTRSMYEQLTPDGMEMVYCRYMDSMGILASMANRLIMNSPMPSYEQVMTWDRYLVPPSKLLDPILGRWMGRSLLGIWKLKASTPTS
ncbi:MAG: class I SAM-dependent methyltransferase [Magnetococcales bacterium]|nr:class I SAM-dependent methyltransferase [Magnetococcales bacterium]